MRQKKWSISPFPIISLCPIICRAILLVFRENNFISMSSCIHLQCWHLYVKQLTENQRMGDVSSVAHQSSFNSFGTNPSSRGISYLARYSCAAKKPITSEWRYIDNVLSPGGFTSSFGMMSIFDTANLIDLGSKTGYRTLKSLKMSNNLLIHQAAVSIPITMLCWSNVTVESRRRPIMQISKFPNFTAVYLFWYMKQSDNESFDDMSCTWNAGNVIGMIS